MARETRECRRCKETKPVSEFGKASSYKDGVSRTCRVCHREEVRDSARRHRDNVRAKQRRWAKANRDKVSAHWAVAKAVRNGVLIRPDRCEDCGGEAGLDGLHAHHEDHSKPLAVAWLCPTCHGIRHGQVEVQNVAA